MRPGADAVDVMGTWSEAFKVSQDTAWRGDADIGEEQDACRGTGRVVGAPRGLLK